MQLLSVNVGVERTIKNGKKTETSGIFKIPTSDPVQINRLGLAHDVIIDTKHHGGVDQAVYVFGQPDYEWWSAQLGVALEAGIFGENLTISDLESATMRIGDRLHIGSDVILEVTSPRIPCATLAARMGDPQFVKRFKEAERPGVYCRVISEGKVSAGDSVTLKPYPRPQQTITVLEFFRIAYQREISGEQMRRLLAAPIDIRSRTAYEQMLTDA
ncbi:MAG: MOSC domain-containing protein [Anaerolineae bacterium]|nr:MOSC domain-containing protein [Anaerolineae bacterium]